MSASASRSSPLLVDVVVVARDAAATLGGVLAALPRRAVRSVVVVDAGSRDATAHVARDAGAVVLREASGGYGAAANRAIAHLAMLPVPPDVVAFLGGDGADDPAELGRLVDAIQHDGAELVVGVRPGARALESRLAVGLIGVLYRHRFHGLGRFRAIRFPALIALGLRDGGTGWDVEMQVRALALGLKTAEVELTSAGAGEPPRPRERLAGAGRALFQILRHATTR